MPLQTIQVNDFLAVLHSLNDCPYLKYHTHYSPL